MRPPQVGKGTYGGCSSMVERRVVVPVMGVQFSSLTPSDRSVKAAYEVSNLLVAVRIRSVALTSDSLDVWIAADVNLVSLAKRLTAALEVMEDVVAPPPPQ